MHVVIFSGGTILKSNLVIKAIQEADVVISADQGARNALAFGIVPHIIVGDNDSLSKKEQEELVKKGSKFVVMPTTLLSKSSLNSQEKDQTDTELAINYATKHGASSITILGGNAGDRFDHVIANLLLATTISVPIMFINGNQQLIILHGPTSYVIEDKKNDLVSLIPLSTEVTGITTSNLYYPLQNETLFFGLPRGVSNVLTDKKAEVEFKKGILLLVHTII